MRLQFATASQKKRNISATPYAFTEQGLAMLSGILNSDKAIDVNIAIMRAFVMLRQYALTYKDLAEKLEILANKFDTHDKQFNDVFEALNLLLQDKEEETDFEKRERIGF
jgi:hypothetical protein